MEFALFRFTGNDYWVSARFRERSCFRINSQVRLPTLCIWSVASIAVIRKNRADVKVVLKGGLWRFALFRGRSVKS